MTARKKRTAMRKIDAMRTAVLSAIVVATASLASAGGAMAFDEKVFDDNGAVKPKSSPWAVFQFGFSAYKSGHKDQAVEAYRYAAENGQIGATWKLARMYAEGDGVDRNDFEAFKFYSEIVDQDVEPGSPEESYVSDALVALGSYLKKGIPDSPIKANKAAAQEYFMRAAANYRNPDAQFEMGKMFLKGEGGVKASVRQAGRWLQLAAEKGHAGAGDTRQSAVPVRQGGARPGHDDRRARACGAGRPALDPQHAGRGLRPCRRSGSPHRDRACRGYPHQGQHAVSGAGATAHL